MSKEVRYLYSVYPRKTITGLSKDIGNIRVPKSLQLTKEEVLICLKYGPVMRRFANEGKNVKVIPSNLDRLHNAKFMTEEEYANFVNQVGRVEINDTDVDEEEVANNQDATPEEKSEVEEAEAEAPVSDSTEEELPAETPVETEEATDDEENAEAEETASSDAESESETDSEDSDEVLDTTEDDSENDPAPESETEKDSENDRSPVSQTDVNQHITTFNGNNNKGKNNKHRR